VAALFLTAWQILTEQRHAQAESVPVRIEN